MLLEVCKGKDAKVFEPQAFEEGGLLVGRGLLLLLPELLDERHRLPLKTARELPPDAAREQLHQLLVVHVQQLVEIDAAVRVLAESTLLLELSRIVSHGSALM